MPTGSAQIEALVIEVAACACALMDMVALPANEANVQRAISYHAQATGSVFLQESWQQRIVETCTDCGIKTSLWDARVSRVTMVLTAAC